MTRVGYRQEKNRLSVAKKFDSNYLGKIWRIFFSLQLKRREIIIVRGQSYVSRLRAEE